VVLTNTDVFKYTNVLTDWY